HQQQVVQQWVSPRLLPTSGADHNISTKGSVVTLSCYKKEPKIQIEEETYYNDASKKIRSTSIKPGAFLIPYTLMLIFGAVPLFYMELILGQYNRQGPITIWKICPLFKGWAFYFLVSSARSELPWLHCDNAWNTEQCWDAARHNATNKTEMQYSEGLNDLGFPKWQLALCLALVYFTLYLSLFKGVKSSGKVVWMTATMPYVVLSILLARGLLLPGATRGIAYYLQPELTRLKDTQVILTLTKLHVTLNNITFIFCRDCLVTTLVNCFTSFFSGFVIFTYLGFMSHKQGVPISSVATEGPGLVFQVYPEAVATLPGASIWAMLFFFMLIMLGLDSGMGGLECVITGLLDQARASGAHWLRREHFTLLVVCVSFCVACINITPGGIYMFHLLDTYAAGISLLCSALFEAVAVSWFYGKQLAHYDHNCDTYEMK
ncbi:hypothetical protein MSG28_013684, partial [Choristoneura fumiferana]